MTQRRSPSRHVARQTYHRQQGIALITALLVLLVITVIGAALGTSGAMLQRTVTAQEDSALSLAAAETTLVAIERAIQKNKVSHPAAVNPDSSDSDRFVTGFDAAGDRWWQDDSNWSAGLTLGAGNLFATDKPLESASIDLSAMALAAAPQFRVEVDMSDTALRRLTAEEGASGLRLYQVTVKASGRGNARSVVQSVYGVMEVE